MGKQIPYTPRIQRKQIRLQCGHVITFQIEFYPTNGEEVWCYKCGNYTVINNGRSPVTPNQMRLDNIIYSE